MAATLHQLELEIDRSFAAAGLPLPPTAAGPAELRRRAAAARISDAGRREAVASRERAIATLATATAEREAAEGASAAAVDAVAAGRVRWAAALGAAGLPSSLDYAAAMALVTRLESAKGTLGERADLGRTIARTERDRLEWEQGIGRLAADLGIEARDTDADALVERLRQELAGARTAQRRKDALVVQRDVAGAEERKANEDLVAARTAYGTFLAGHGVASAEQLHQRHEQTSDRGKAEDRLRQAEAAFAGIVPEDRRPDVEASLRAADPGVLDARAAAIGDEIAAVRERRDGLVAREGELGEQVRRLADEVRRPIFLLHQPLLLFVEEQWITAEFRQLVAGQELVPLGVINVCRFVGQNRHVHKDVTIATASLEYGL